MIVKAAWHAANLRKGYLIDALRDWNEYNDAVDAMIEPNGGVFTVSLADNLEFCTWHHAWFATNTLYGYEDDIILNDVKIDRYCSALV